MYKKMHIFGNLNFVSKFAKLTIIALNNERKVPHEMTINLLKNDYLGAFHEQ